MNKLHKYLYSHSSKRAFAAGVSATALVFSIGCSGEQGGKEGSTGGTKDPGSSQEETQSKEENSSEGVDVPSQKNVQVKLSDIPEGIEDLRIAVHPELDFSGKGSKLGEALADVEVKAKEASLVDLTVEPIAAGIELGEAKTTILYISMYVDKDKSKGFTPGEEIVGSVLATLAYSRADNAKKLPEWTQVDMSSGKLVEVNKALEMARLDNLEAVETLAFPVKTKSIEKEVTLLGLVSPAEAKDFAKNFLEASRGELLKVDRDKAELTLNLRKAPDEARKGSNSLGYLPRFKNMSVNLLAGFKTTGETVTKDAEILGLGCVALEFAGKQIYDSVFALWVEPGPNWLKDPASAYTVLVDGYRPGWNPIAVQSEDDGSFFAYRMEEPDMDKLAFSPDCKAPTQSP